MRRLLDHLRGRRARAPLTSRLDAAGVKSRDDVTLAELLSGKPLGVHFIIDAEGVVYHVVDGVAHEVRRDFDLEL